MDFQFWIYVIIAVVLAIRSIIKKAQNQPGDVIDNTKPGREVRYDTTQPMEKPKPLTFEELLKEITEAKQPQREVSQPQRPVQRPVYESLPPSQGYVDYDDNLGKEEQSLEEVDRNYRDRDKLYDVYEEAKKQAFLRPSLEETMNVRDTNMSFGKFKEFEKQEQRNLMQEYLIDFQDPEGLKKAFVMSEVLNRKF
jgi:hypothetical protein